ncbi:hypothetical protein RHGRI_003266 [Rhododendron griersonianum]|uniref:C2 domain-containing protein n=1 Tax=Rhododendron griersonianum TaxID=479676 RepID=A0AAV6L4U0_9ERIC|nr:hypothetical protein RHGRI_003266 [Rhododendron griersonianum]
MAYRLLEINAMSAKDLKKVTLISKMRPYAVVSISGGDPRASQPQWTAVDRSGNASPTWNFPLKFFVEESAARSNRLGVTFKIRCERGDKDIGEVHVPLSDLIGPTEDGELLHSVTYQVRRPSGKPNKGELNFSYKWGPVTAYPAQVGPSPVSLPHPTEYDRLLPQPKKKNWLAKFLCVLGKLCGDVIGNSNFRLIQYRVLVESSSVCLVREAVHGLRESTASRTSRLQQEMSTMQDSGSAVKAEWKEGIDANQNLRAQFSSDMSSTLEDVDFPSKKLMSSIDHSLQLDHDACGNLDSMILPCCGELREPKGGHYHNIVEIMKNAGKCLLSEYAELELRLKQIFRIFDLEEMVIKMAHCT